jgi:hypothetical protein
MKIFNRYYNRTQGLNCTPNHPPSMLLFKYLIIISDEFTFHEFVFDRIRIQTEPEFILNSFDKFVRIQINLTKFWPNHEKYVQIINWSLWSNFWPNYTNFKTNFQQILDKILVSKTESNLDPNYSVWILIWTNFKRTEFKFVRDYMRVLYLQLLLFHIKRDVGHDNSALKGWAASVDMDPKSILRNIFEPQCLVENII